MSNITLYGDGGSSVLYVPNWTDDADAYVEGYVNIIAAGQDVENVRVEDLRMLGNRNSCWNTPGIEKRPRTSLTRSRKCLPCSFKSSGSTSATHASGGR